MKDLNPFKTVLKVQGASSILRMSFALSKYPHFNSTYVVKVRFSLDLAVRANFKSKFEIDIKSFLTFKLHATKVLFQA